MTAPTAPSPSLRLRPPQHRLDRRAVWWWMASSASFGLPIIVGTVVGMVLWEAARPWLLPVLIGAVLLTLVTTLVEPQWRYAVHRWEATDEAVYALTGWIVREWRVAPISRIQTVDAVRGPLEQWFGLATLRVTTASSSGAIDIVGLDHEVAADLAEKLTAIAQTIPGDAT